MNPEIKAKWVAALRSGKYKQGQNRLRRKNEFCCLGVLCDLHAKATGARWDGESYFGHEILTPDAVREWGDLPDDDPFIDDDYLSSHNDEGKTFAKIADIIEREL